MRISHKLILGFAGIVLLAVIAGCIALWQLKKIAAPLNKKIPESIRAVEETSLLDGLAQFIRYYDEVLTQSARNYAFTQAKHWEHRYRDVEPKLDKIIKEAIEKGDEKDKEFFSSVDKANLALAEMEYKSIALVNNEQAEEAVKILESDEYWNQKDVYEKGLMDYVHRRGAEYDEALSASTQMVSSAAEQAQNLIKTTRLLVSTFIVIVLILSTGISFLVFRSISCPIAELQAAAIEIGAGKLDIKVDIKPNDEVGQLAASFNKMAKDLKTSTTSIDNLNKEIVERQQAEEALEALNKELQTTVEKLSTTNRELEDFAHIIAHDLKTPLRAIGTLADWLSTDYADKFDDQGKEQVGLLVKRAKRMTNFIDSILQYSRLGRVEKERVRVNLNELVTEAIDMAAPPENIKITIENTLPTLESEKTRILEVFQNLLSNAAKYMDKPKGRIRIGCAEQNGFWKFSVADNGRGIEEKHFKKIFKIFQTLSPRDESESTGIGLTVVKKIVELYGGKIWVESKPGKGSTFYFTLPKQGTTFCDALQNGTEKMGVTNAKLETNIVSGG